VIVASVQTLLSPERRAALPPPTHIIVDEAHHVLAESYQAVLNHWPDARVLGVTATPDRGDMRDLGAFFESLAYEYTLPQAIADGFLCRIKALTCPLKIDVRGVTVNGDYQAGSLGTALDPYLPKIAAEMAQHCRGRRTLCFLPLIATSKRIVEYLTAAGLRAREVNGDSEDRAAALAEFHDGRWDVLCNAMLLTEGYDEPGIDCVVVLRPTKIRSLYAQMVGRGTRIHPGKENLLLLDFLWMSEKHRICRPAHLVAEDDEVAQKMAEASEREPGAEQDLDEAALAAAKADVVKDREAALAKKLAEMRHRRRELVDPVQYAVSVGAPDLVEYRPALPADAAPVTPAQVEALSKAGLFPGDVQHAGHAAALLDALAERKGGGFSTPRQVRCLERYGWKRAGQMKYAEAQRLIGRIAANGWRLPHGLKPQEEA
jgi:superfamily II DNA or RNA helicase